MSLSSRLSVPAVLATGLILVVACSSESARPPQLGDCVPVGDAGCSAPDPGGGGGAGPPVVDSGGGGGTTPEGGNTCGAAVGFFTTNTTCVPCIEGQTAGILGCCEASLACSGQAGCFALLQCMEGCLSTDASCPGACENTNPTGVTAYDDLAECFTSECSPQCPTLPQPGAGDF